MLHTAKMLTSLKIEAQGADQIYSGSEYCDQGDGGLMVNISAWRARDVGSSPDQPSREQKSQSGEACYHGQRWKAIKLGDGQHDRRELRWKSGGLPSPFGWIWAHMHVVDRSLTLKNELRDRERKKASHFANLCNQKTVDLQNFKKTDFVQ